MRIAERATNSSPWSFKTLPLFNSLASCIARVVDFLAALPMAGANKRRRITLVRHALPAAVLSVALASNVGAAEVGAQSTIEAVTVFPSGAEVTRIAKIKLEKGDHVILFRDLPAGAVDGSIRVEGNATGKLEIGSVDTRRMFVPRADAEASESQRRRIETEIEKLRDGRVVLEAQVQGAETQKTLISNLAQLPQRPAPSQGGERGEDWPSILALIGSGITEAQKVAQEAQVKMRDVDRQIEELEKELATLAPPREERTEAKVFVSASQALDADLTVRYQVPAASWTPLYDLRLATGAKTDAPKIALTRRAAINQQTGEAWDNVALSLSTTRPAAGASAPDVNPVIVDFEPPPRPAPVPMTMSRAARPESEAAEASDGVAAAPEMSDLVGGVGHPKAALKVDIDAKPVDVAVAPFHAIFAVPGRASIPDTGETKRVQLLDEQMEPQLTLRTVPKLDAKAYLYAKFALPKGSPLLPGSVALFRDGTFVGNDRLPLLSPSEEHEVGFGADDLVKVRFAISEEKRGETGLISTSRTDVRNYRISIKNMHERALALSVFDQLPVAENQEIKVELTSKLAPTRQNVDDKRGVVAWDSKIEPDQEQVIDFGYRVSWPAAKSIIYR